MRVPPRGLPDALLWPAVAAVLAGLAAWALAHGYLNETASYRWGLVGTVLGAPEFRLENLGLLYPHVPLYLLVPFYVLPGLATPFAPYLASALTGALLLGLWYRHLRQRRYPRASALLLVLLVAGHPLFLWVATSGTEKALSLLLFYGLCLACVRLMYVGDVRSVIMLGGLLALYFFVDERTVFLFVALLPLLPILAPLRMLRASMASAYVLISLPVVVAIAAWIYLNWLFHGDPWLFLSSSESAFVGVSRVAQDIAWLREAGGTFLAAFAGTALLAAAALPALGWTLFRLRRRSRLLVGVGILSLHPVLSAAVATKLNFLDHPLNLVFLMLGALMVSLLLMRKALVRRPAVPAAWFLASALGGWWAFGLAPTDEMGRWLAAMGGARLADRHAADRRVGQWLAEHRETTLIDSRAAHHVVVARGDARGLWLPFMPEFKLAERRSRLYADQVVVLDPRHPMASRDRITQRFPALYSDGMAGFEPVFDAPPWRVYRRHGARPAEQ